MDRRRAACVLFLCLLAPFLWGEAGEWSCALTVFEGNLDRENLFLFRQIPLQLYHNISSYPEHILDRDELLYEKERSSESSRRELLDRWESLHEEKDNLLFSEDPIKYESLTEDIRDIRAEYDRADKPGGEESPARTLKYLTPGQGGILFSTEEDALAKDPDFLIKGTIDDAGSFILIELTGVSPAREEEIPLWTGAGKNDELERLIGEMTDALKGVLLGREWSALEVTADPVSAQISLNGKSLGVGAVEEEILEPGPAMLEIRYPRHRIYSEEILLEPGKRIIRTVSLEAGEVELVSLETEPSGADVILGSVYKGQTPLVLPRPLFTEKLILTKEGYDSLSADLGPDSPDHVRFSLTSGGVDWEQERLASKDRFYNSLGWFALSLAEPLITHGIRENQFQRANSASLAGNQSAYDEATGSYYLSSGLFWGGVAVSGALLGVSITRLVQYIKASEKSIELR